jgi:xylan 1,4-beta-xylosidase
MWNVERWPASGLLCHTRRLLLICVLGVSAVFGGGHARAQGSSADLRRITVDAATITGRLRSLAGVNGAPAPGMHKPEKFTFGGWNMPEQVDASRGYELAHIDLVRTHDAYGPGDIDAKFETHEAPGGALISAQRDLYTLFPDPNANPEDPASYRFGPTDELVTSIVKVGAQAIFRLGRSEGADPQPPHDFDRYASIAKHIVLHYNAGWAHGYHYGIRYWEIWNEPDLGKVFWAGTPEQYFSLYSKIARAVKQADPAVLVGGPAIARPNDASPYRDAFMEYVHQTRTPLDFYSWHWYATDSEDPLDFVRIARDLRSRLDRHGLQRTQSILSEWNYGLSDTPPAPLVRASFITSALIYMQDAPVDAATLYRADNVFGADGDSPDEIGQALIALGRMKATPVRLQSTGGDLRGLAVEAGRSEDGKLVQVLISNDQIPAADLGPRNTDDTLHVPHVFDVKLLPRRSLVYSDNGGFDLTIAQLPAGTPHVVERCLISAEGTFASGTPIVQTGGTVTVQGRLPPPGIALISVRAVDPAAVPPGPTVGAHCGAPSGAPRGIGPGS